MEEDPTGWATRPLAENGGFIETQFNDMFNVQVGVSMFHTLHCIERVRGKIVANGTEEMHSHHDPLNTLNRDPEARQLHLKHCLDCIVQVIMCGCDETLEPSRFHLDKQGNIVAQEVSPEGTIHMCKNTNHLYNLVLNSAKKPLPSYMPKPGDTVEKVDSAPAQ
ncbi:hypothetical protein K458DRAFT_466431 [Lentithecium fluviatile CBS 122367]|uniref:Uncharacterized protein n=1 Tax=Lentithecium fluviatile CBS 122367 TaxID=1168545 RepID=A0A6G1IGV4_9PLEO|nr:hypothetical protein K458DRAFT_466431 [Lentithecium fluviatile CBS 122367]